jgi:putative pyruvate formate lyase activating enzyme
MQMPRACPWVGPFRNGTMNMTADAYPGYRRLIAAGKLEKKLTALRGMLSSCRLCPRLCGVDRTSGRTGFCNGGKRASVSSFGPHYGEEAPLVGSGGSGTIFFAGCNLGCCFCQNYEISHLCQGREVSVEDLAGTMLKLQEMGCHNVNLVTPTHFTPQIAEAVKVAAAGGLKLPIVYNCGGYESDETLRLLEGIVDIYMPDFKFWSAASSERYLNAPDYPAAARSALKEMHRQVGDLVIRDGLALRGLLVRHLVMPGHFADSREILKFLAEEVSPGTFVNVMAQYRPCYRSDEFPEIASRPKNEELKQALELAHRVGLTRIYY